MAHKKLDVNRIFHALGDATRRLMMERLRDGPVSVSQLAMPFSMSLAAVVQHLKILEEAGLVHTEKVGRVRTCRIEPVGLSAAMQWLEDCRPEWDKRFDRLGQFLAHTESKRPPR